MGKGVSYAAPIKGVDIVNVMAELREKQNKNKYRLKRAKRAVKRKMNLP